MSENKELELNERETKLNEIQKQLKINIDKFKQEKEGFQNDKDAYLKDKQEFENFMQNKEVFKKELEQKVKESLLAYERKQKESILERVNKEIQEQQEYLNKDYKKKLESIQECSNKLENNLKTQFDTQLAQWEQSFSGYAKQLNEILQTKEQLKLEKQQFNAKKQAFENHMKQREEEIKKGKEREMERLKEENSGLNQQLDAIQREIRGLRQEKRELEAQIDLQSDFNREKLEQDKRLLEEHKNELFKDNEELKNKIQSLENEKNKLDPRDETIKELEEKLRGLENIQAQKEHNDNLYQGLLARNTALQAELNELKEKFENLKNIYAGVEDFDKRKNNIKEQIIKASPKTLKTPSDITDKDELKFLNDIEEGMQKFHVFYPKRLLYMFHTALKSASLSPLSVLSGVSGTGKSELPKLYAHFGGLNFLSIAVQPTWDSPESLMGYFNAIENKFDATEFLRFFIQTALDKEELDCSLKESMNIVLLDEMNLAHIELYFAEFLSKLEIKRSKETNVSIKLGTGLTWELPLRDNLLFVGTMNEDESTKMLSDKVLDRAFCLNFERPKDLKSKQQKRLLDNNNYLKAEVFSSWINKKGDLENKLKKYKTLTERINENLSACSRSIGHRVWQSMSAYMHNHPLVKYANDKDKALKYVYEECLILKIFPKLRGVETRKNNHLKNIQDLLKDFNVVKDFEQAMENDFNQFVFNSASYLNDNEYEKIISEINK
ncbi:restriction endonuclease [Helicobacter cetorum]|uniref:restriction endonuclease n=1 Tax=Helicobacter cetorum TaxID=138563 RepID=UPI001F37371A|nr:restriction endonuclease [Helicobacter cetorum]